MTREAAQFFALFPGFGKTGWLRVRQFVLRTAWQNLIDKQKSPEP